MAEQVSSEIEADGMRVAIGGALALAVSGVARATTDVDINVFVPPMEVERVLRALRRVAPIHDEAGAHADGTASAQFRVELLTPAGRARVDVFLMVEDRLYEEIFAECVQVGGMRFLGPTASALFKLLFRRAKDIADLEKLFVVCPEVDVPKLQAWLARFVEDGDDRFEELSRLALLRAAP